MYSTGIEHKRPFLSSQLFSDGTSTHFVSIWPKPGTHTLYDSHIFWNNNNADPQRKHTHTHARTRCSKTHAQTPAVDAVVGALIRPWVVKHHTDRCSRASTSGETRHRRRNQKYLATVGRPDSLTWLTAVTLCFSSPPVPHTFPLVLDFKGNASKSTVEKVTQKNKTKKKQKTKI